MVLNVFIQFFGGKMWLLLWRWVEEVLFTNLLPKRCGAPHGIQRVLGTPVLWEELKEGDTSKTGGDARH